MICNKELRSSFLFVFLLLSVFFVGAHSQLPKTNLLFYNTSLLFFNRTHYSYGSLPRAINTTLTLSVWIDLTTSGNLMSLGRSPTTYSNEMTFNLQGDLLTFSDSDGSGVSGFNNNVPTPIPLNKRTHVAFVRDHLTGYFYLNGKPIGTITSTLSIYYNNVNFCIGADCRDFGPGNYAHGTMDHVMVYGASLNASEVFQIYKAQLDAFTPTVTPSVIPSFAPSCFPTLSPSVVPTVGPTSFPALSPTSVVPMVIVTSFAPSSSNATASSTAKSLFNPTATLVLAVALPFCCLFLLFYIHCQLHKQYQESKSDGKDQSQWQTSPTKVQSGVMDGGGDTVNSPFSPSQELVEQNGFTGRSSITGVPVSMANIAKLREGEL